MGLAIDFLIAACSSDSDETAEALAALISVTVDFRVPTAAVFAVTAWFWCIGRCLGFGRCGLGVGRCLLRLLELRIFIRQAGLQAVDLPLHLLAQGLDLFFDGWAFRFGLPGSGLLRCSIAA